MYDAFPTEGNTSVPTAFNHQKVTFINNLKLPDFMEDYQPPVMPGLKSSYLDMNGSASGLFSKHIDIGRAIGAKQDAIRDYHSAHGSVIDMPLDDVPTAAREKLDAILEAEHEAIETGQPFVLPGLAQEAKSRRAQKVPRLLTSRRPQF